MLPLLPDVSAAAVLLLFVVLVRSLLLLAFVDDPFFDQQQQQDNTFRWWLQLRHHPTASSSVSDMIAADLPTATISLQNEPPNVVDHCITSVDCAMNGECIKGSGGGGDSGGGGVGVDPQSPGTCRCFAGWKGSTCERLDLLPVNSTLAVSGLQLANHSSSWGGSVIYWQGEYHMFASEITNRCGLYSWTTNSQVIRATSNTWYGPYEKQQVIVPVFAHDANVMIAPSTNEIVLYVTARSGVEPIDCTNSTSPAASIRNYSNNNNNNNQTPPKDTYMLHASNPQGPWSDPVLVLNSTIWNEDYWNRTGKYAHCDSNLNGIIRDDNSFWGLWRRCETSELKTVPHALVAADWRDPITYLPDVNPLLKSGSHFYARMTTNVRLLAFIEGHLIPETSELSRPPALGQNLTINPIPVVLNQIIVSFNRQHQRWPPCRTNGLKC